MIRIRKQNNIDSIIVHPKSEKQMNLLKTLLEELKIKFEISKTEKVIKLSDFEKYLIKKGIEYADNGRLISSDEARKMAERRSK